MVVRSNIGPLTLREKLVGYKMILTSMLWYAYCVLMAVGVMLRQVLPQFKLAQSRLMCERQYGAICETVIKVMGVAIMKANQKANQQEKRVDIPEEVLAQARSEAFMMRVLRAMATQMELRDVTKADLAVRLNVGKSRISNLFHAKNMTMKTLYEIGEALDAIVEVKFHPRKSCIQKKASKHKQEARSVSKSAPASNSQSTRYRESHIVTV